jgi:hypothetical protein
MKKKIVLLGDSIRLAYGQYVPELLGDDYDVWQPADNCRFAQYTLRMLFDEKHNLDGSHVIHWNNGLWDVPELFDDGVFTPEDMYVNTMLRIAKILKSYTPNVIFATTTPVHPEYPYNDNKKIERMNALLVPKLKEMGIVINDLHALAMADLDGYLCEDKIHPSETGAKNCAMQVVQLIKQFD